MAANKRPLGAMAPIASHTSAGNDVELAVRDWHSFVCVCVLTKAKRINLLSSEHSFVGLFQMGQM